MALNFSSSSCANCFSKPSSRLSNVVIASPSCRVDPGSFDPGSFDPGSINPGLVDPGPADPGAIDPGSLDPGHLAHDIECRRQNINVTDGVAARIDSAMEQSLRASQAWGRQVRRAVRDKAFRLCRRARWARLLAQGRDRLYLVSAAFTKPRNITSRLGNLGIRWTNHGTHP